MNLEDFAAARPVTRTGPVAWLETCPLRATVLAGWAKGMTAGVIHRWLVTDQGQEGVPTRSALHRYLSDRYPRG